MHVLACVGPVHAQSAGPDGGSTAPVTAPSIEDTAGGDEDARGGDGTARGGNSETVTMHMLFEATIFRIDVLELSVEIRGTDADRLRALVVPSRGTPATRDAMARVAAHVTDAHARLSFLRGVSLDRLLDEIRGSAGAARAAGFITDETLALVSRSLPDWYGFLEGRGVEEGDEMLYRIRGDSLDIRYRTASGKLLMNRSDVGAQRRLAVMGGYFAAGSAFREGLIDSLLESYGESEP